MNIRTHRAVQARIRQQRNDYVPGMVLLLICELVLLYIAK